MNEATEEVGPFAERLNSLLAEAKEYPASLARVLGISHVAVLRYIGGRVPRAEELAKIAQHYQVSMEWLLGITDERKPGMGSRSHGTGEAEAWRARALAAETKLAQLQQLLGRGPAAVPQRISSGSAGQPVPPPERGAAPAPVAGLPKQKIGRHGAQGTDPLVESRAADALLEAGRSARVAAAAYREKQKGSSPTGKASAPASGSARNPSP